MMIIICGEFMNYFCVDFKNETNGNSNYHSNDNKCITCDGSKEK